MFIIIFWVNESIVFLFDFCRFGRRNVALLSLVLQLLFGIASAFSPNIYVYIALRFVVAAALSGVWMNSYVLG